MADIDEEEKGQERELEELCSLQWLGRRVRSNLERERENGIKLYEN